MKNQNLKEKYRRIPLKKLPGLSMAEEYPKILSQARPPLPPFRTEEKMQWPDWKNASIALFEFRFFKHDGYVKQSAAIIFEPSHFGNRGRSAFPANVARQRAIPRNRPNQHSPFSPIQLRTSGNRLPKIFRSSLENQRGTTACRESVLARFRFSTNRTINGFSIRSSHLIGTGKGDRCK